MDNSIPHVIYHYCGVDSFYNIIQSKLLRFGSIYHFRDYSEQLALLKRFYEIIKTYRSKDPSLYKLLLNVKQRLNNMEDAFAVCFSANKDLLSQWRSYASDGEGYSIGFNTAFFSKYKSGIKLPPKDNYPFLISKVFYNEEDHNKLIDNAISVMENLKKSHGIEASEEFGESLIRMVNMFSKYQHFSEEDEVRLIIRRAQFDINQVKKYPVKYYLSRSSIVPVIEESISLLNGSESKPIAFVNLGPRNTSTIGDVKSFLDANGFAGAEVSKSDITYR